MTPQFDETLTRASRPHSRPTVATYRRSLLRGLALPLLSAALSCGERAGAAEPVRIFYDVFDNAPFINGSGAAIPAKPGLTIELIRMAAARSHVAITLTRTPWQRGLYLIQTGQADAIFASSFVKDRLRYGVYPMQDGALDPSRKLFDQSYRLYVRAGSGVRWDGKTLSNLHGPVGATPGYAVVPMLRAMGVTVEEESSHIANLRKLVAGRLDAYAELDNHVRPLLQANPQEFHNIVELSPPLLTKPYFLMFSKIFYEKTPAVAERIWDAIGTVRTSPAYQTMLHNENIGD